VAAAFGGAPVPGTGSVYDDELAVRLTQKLVERPGGLADDGGTLVGAVWVARPGLLGEPDAQAWAAVVHSARSLGAMREAPVELPPWPQPPSACWLRRAARRTREPTWFAPRAGPDVPSSTTWPRGARGRRSTAKTNSASRDRTAAILVLAVVVGDPGRRRRLYRYVGVLDTPTRSGSWPSCSGPTAS
jgi:hypothetical protein